jgi:hypothetical protein
MFSEAAQQHGIVLWYIALLPLDWYPSHPPPSQPNTCACCFNLYATSALLNTTASTVPCGTYHSVLFTAIQARHSPDTYAPLLQPLCCMRAAEHHDDISVSLSTALLPVHCYTNPFPLLSKLLHQPLSVTTNCYTNPFPLLSQLLH